LSGAKKMITVVDKPFPSGMFGDLRRYFKGYIKGSLQSCGHNQLNFIHS